jgi:hypothetical protein
MRKPFLKGSTSTRDPERRRLWVTTGRRPQPIPGPWTLQAVVQSDVIQSNAVRPDVVESDKGARKAPERGRARGTQ